MWNKTKETELTATALKTELHTSQCDRAAQKSQMEQLQLAQAEAEQLYEIQKAENEMFYGRSIYMYITRTCQPHTLKICDIFKY